MFTSDQFPIALQTAFLSWVILFSIQFFIIHMNGHKQFLPDFFLIIIHLSCYEWFLFDSHLFIIHANGINGLPRQDEDSPVVCLNSNDLSVRLERDDLLLSNGAHSFPRLSIPQRTDNGRWLAIDKDMTDAVNDCHKREIGGVDSELSFLLRRLDVAEGIECANVLPR